MQPGPSLKSAVIEITNWMLVRPETQIWLRYNRVEDDAAGTIIAKIMLGQLDDMKSFTGKSIEEHIRDIIVEKNIQPLHGICDKYWIANDIITKWIATWLNPLPKKQDPVTMKAYKKLNTVLDYYGRTGGLSLRIGTRLKSSITYIDQNPYFSYARFRFRLPKYRIHYSTKCIEATPENSRPLPGTDKFGFISSLELPTEISPEWIDWFESHTLPLGFVATCANLPWKKVDKLPEIGFIYQNTPH